MPRFSPAARTAMDRRVREDQADRLHDDVPELVELRFDIEDQASFEVGPPVSYVRHVVVATAPAMFDIPCGARKCEGGGHDITPGVLRALKRHKTSAKGTSTCRGERGGEPCNRELRYQLTARYDDD